LEIPQTNSSVSPLARLRAHEQQKYAPPIRPDDPRLQEILAESQEFQTLPVVDQQKLVRSAILMARHYDRDTLSQTASDPIETGELIKDAARSSLCFIAAGWSGSTAVKLALRHSPEEISELIEEFSVHPMLTPKRCKDLIDRQTTNPRQLLQDIVDYCRIARTDHRILQLSNHAILAHATTDDLRQKNFDTLLGHEFDAYQPLSSKPELALQQLRVPGGRIGKNKQTAQATQPVQRYILTVLGSIRHAAQRQDSNVVDLDMTLFAEKYALNADAHDYESLSAEQVSAVAQQYIREVQAIIALGVTHKAALKAVLAHPVEYLEEFFSTAQQEAVTVGRATGILNRYGTNSLEQLQAVCRRRDDIAEQAQELTHAQSLQLAFNTLGSGKSAAKIIKELRENLETADLLFGTSFTPRFIVETCIETPIKCLDTLKDAHKILTRMQEKYGDPCMPPSFIREQVEDSARRTLARRLAQCHKTIQRLRQRQPHASDKDIWMQTRRYCGLSIK